MLAWRQSSKLTIAALAPLLLAATAAPVAAQGKLDARYSVTLAGIPVGEGTWLIDLNDSQYSASVNGTTLGLLKVFTSGRGRSVTRGTLQAGKPLQSTYNATIESSRKTDVVSVTVDGGSVTASKVEPPVDPDAERVPVTAQVKEGVLDPVTATMVRMTGNGSLIAPEACQRTLSVFDGKLRYDLQLAFKRMDKVKADKGYDGPVVVCSVYFKPIAGHVPSRAAIKYVSAQRDIEVWLAPIAGTRVLVPFRAEGPTPIGHAVLQATQFETVAIAKEPGKEPTKASIRTNERPMDKASDKVGPLKTP